MEITRVFVYGTLMKGLSNYSVIKPFVKSICAGKTRGILYDLPYGYPAVKPGQGVVHGEVVELQDVAEALQVLDSLEGYNGRGVPDNLYERVVQEVELAGGERVLAYLYIWGKPAALEELGTVVPKGNWGNYRIGK
jgi:gamma-glutamylcyclotransferase (GGCT)/AIG2-like uncharacterized protein YtfP